MNKSVLVLSTKVDNMLVTQDESTNYLIFNRLDDLAQDIEEVRIKVDVAYITLDMLNGRVTSQLLNLQQLFQNPFLSAGRVEFILDAESKEEKLVIEHLIKESNLLTWNIHIGLLTREYLMNYISGKLGDEKKDPVRKAVYRVRRADLLKQRSVDLDDVDEIDDDYIDNEDLSEINIETEDTIPTLQSLDKCEIEYISGIESFERSVFSFLFAQYLAKRYKTVIVETEFRYLTLSDMVSRSNVSCTKISIENLYRDPQNTLKKIRTTTDKLIVLVTRNRSNYDYDFICNLIYNNLNDCVEYIVQERNLNDLNTSTKYTCVVPNNIISTLKTIDNIPTNYKECCKFVAINSRSVKELSVLDSKGLGNILMDCLDYSDIVDIPVLNITGLKLGGESHDLRMFIRSRS